VEEFPTLMYVRGPGFDFTWRHDGPRCNLSIFTTFPSNYVFVGCFGPY